MPPVKCRESPWLWVSRQQTLEPPHQEGLGLLDWEGGMLDLVHGGDFGEAFAASPAIPPFFSL